MLYYAVVFFIIALIAMMFGLAGTVAVVATGKILFVVFLVAAFVCLVFGLVERK